MSADRELANRLRTMAAAAQSEGAEWVAMSGDLLLAIAEVLDPEELTDEPELDERFQ